MYKILISGYYGFNNIGDESILSAVVENLKDRLSNIEITVLSQNPESTKEKYNVNSVNRKSMKSIVSAVRKCDLLISGGGSLLQDVTSKKSILYYLFIMWLAKFFGKKFFIYSQGIGPINSKLNRRLTAMTLKKASGIVVRDVFSKELLMEIGIQEKDIEVTADPVIRVKPVELELGRKILFDEGFVKDAEKKAIGFAIKEKKLDSEFVRELAISIKKLSDEQNAKVVLIPFHYSEDMAVICELEKRLGDRVCAIKHKYLTNEMLSIIGNMDILVGVRLHSLIHAAIMDVPMIAISYDPKINSFMNSMGLKAMCSIYDFNNEYFLEEFSKTLADEDIIRKKVKKRISELIKNLDTNEEMIEKLMKRGSC